MTKNEGVWHGEHSLLEIGVQNTAVGMAYTGSEDLNEALVGARGGNWDHLAGNRCTTGRLGDKAESDHLSISRLGLGRHCGYLMGWDHHKVSVHDSA